MQNTYIINKGFDSTGGK